MKWPWSVSLRGKYLHLIRWTQAQSPTQRNSLFLFSPFLFQAPDAWSHLQTLGRSNQSGTLSFWCRSPAISALRPGLRSPYEPPQCRLPYRVQGGPVLPCESAKECGHEAYQHTIHVSVRHWLLAHVWTLRVPQVNGQWKDSHCHSCFQPLHTSPFSHIPKTMQLSRSERGSLETSKVWQCPARHKNF